MRTRTIWWTPTFSPDAGERPAGQRRARGRGRHAALLAAAQSGRLRLALDVTDPNPYGRPPPLRARQLLISPHVGGMSRRLYRELAASFTNSRADAAWRGTNQRDTAHPSHRSPHDDEVDVTKIPSVRPPVMSVPSPASAGETVTLLDHVSPVVPRSRARRKRRLSNQPPAMPLHEVSPIGGPVPRPRRRGRIRQAPRPYATRTLTSTTDARSPNPQVTCPLPRCKGSVAGGSADSRSATRATTSWTSPCNELPNVEHGDSRVGGSLIAATRTRAAHEDPVRWLVESEQPSPRHGRS